MEALARFLFNPHQHDSFSRQAMKLPIVRRTLAQIKVEEAVCVQSMFFYKEPGSHGQAAHQDYYFIAQGYVLRAQLQQIESIPSTRRINICRSARS